jgi:hypothetical protein
MSAYPDLPPQFSPSPYNHVFLETLGFHSSAGSRQPRYLCALDLLHKPVLVALPSTLSTNRHAHPSFRAM